jgi:hypothetical protein
VAAVDDASVFPRALNNVGAARGKALKMYFRGLVRAMLRPKGTEDTELHAVGLPTEKTARSLKLFTR